MKIHQNLSEESKNERKVHLDLQDCK